MRKANDAGLLASLFLSLAFGTCAKNARKRATDERRKMLRLVVKKWFVAFLRSQPSVALCYECCVILSKVGNPLLRSVILSEAEGSSKRNVIARSNATKQSIMVLV